MVDRRMPVVQTAGVSICFFLCFHPIHNTYPRNKNARPIEEHRILQRPQRMRGLCGAWAAALRGHDSWTSTSSCPDAQCARRSVQNRSSRTDRTAPEAEVTSRVDLTKESPISLKPTRLEMARAQSCRSRAQILPHPEQAYWTGRNHQIPGGHIQQPSSD